MNPGDYTSASGHKEKKLDVEDPDSYHRRQACRDQAFAKKPLCTPCEQIEERRVKIGTVEYCHPGTLEIGQTTKIGSKELVEPKAFPAGFKKNICEVNGRDQRDARNCVPG